MKKHKLFSTISLILSGIVIAMSGLIIVHSATSQSVASTLNVTYVANNVAFTASGYYQKKTDDSTTNLVYSGDNSSTTISFAPSNTSTTKNLQTQYASDVTLSTTDTYVLFTYVFHNDASNGGYCIKVSLTDGSTKTNVTCKYLVSDTAYVPAELSTFISSVTGDSAPTDVYIEAQDTKYFYILVSVPNLSLTSSYTSTALSGLVWSVVNTDVTEEPVAQYYTISFSPYTSRGEDVSDGVKPTILWYVSFFYQEGDASQENPIDVPSSSDLGLSNAWHSIENNTISVLSGKKLFLSAKCILSDGYICSTWIADGNSLNYSWDFHVGSRNGTFLSFIVTEDVTFSVEFYGGQPGPRL